MRNKVIKIPIAKLKSHWHKNIEKDFKPSKKYINHLVKDIESGRQIPPIIVVKNRKNYTIVDGHHRVYAYTNKKIKNIDAIVLDGDFKSTKFLRKGGVMFKEYDKKTDYKYNFSKILYLWSSANVQAEINKMSLQRSNIFSQILHAVRKLVTWG